jgi:hypothetical protein
VAGGQPPDELVLGRARVLVLVHEDRPPPLLVAGGQVRFAEQHDRSSDQVVQVERVGALERPLVALVDGGDQPGGVAVAQRPVALRVDEPGLGLADLERDQPHGEPVGRPPLLERAGD